jgi:hypothetical protein
MERGRTTIAAEEITSFLATVTAVSVVGFTGLAIVLSIFYFLAFLWRAAFRWSS